MKPKTEAIPFTKKRLAALPAPKDRLGIFYRDAKTAGLSIRVTATTKTFYLVKWTNGRPLQMPLGRFPEMSVEQATTRVKLLLGEIAQGRDPQVERRNRREEPTFKDLWDHWLRYAKAHKRTWPEDERQYNSFLKPLASRKLSVVKKSDVQALHARMGEKNGPYAANRMLSLVKAMFNKASDMGFRGENPAKGVKRFRETKRDRFLQRDELPAFFQALLAEPNEALRDFFLLCLLTGARRGNVQAMRWEDMDLTAGRWRIPETKSGVAVVVPLCEPALAILQNRRKVANGSPWVFPGRGKTGHLIGPKSAWARILKRAGLSDLRPHDLRRSLGSWQAMGGTSLPIIGKTLGHTQAATTQIYARLQTDSVRASVAAATNGMLEAGGVVIDVDSVKLLEHEKPE